MDDFGGGREIFGFDGGGGEGGGEGVSEVFVVFVEVVEVVVANLESSIEGTSSSSEL